MHHKNFIIMLRFFEKKAFGGCKSQIFVFGNQFAGHEKELGCQADIARGSEFDWL